MARLERTFEALVLDADGAAVPRSGAAVRALRTRLAALLARAVDVALVTAGCAEEVLDRLAPLPAGPGRLLVAAGQGAELVAAGPRGTTRLRRHDDEPATALSLDRSAALVGSRLARHGIAVSRVPSGPAVLRLALGGPVPPDDLSWALSTALLAGEESGLDQPRGWTDGRHVVLSACDHGDALRALLGSFADRGIGPALVLVVGDAFGSDGSIPGRDAPVVPVAGGCTLVSVGPEPGAAPAGVLHVGGGCRALCALLDEQLERREHRLVPEVDPDPEWVLQVPGDDGHLARRDETLLTLGDGTLGLRGSREERHPHETPMVLAAGIYTGQGPGEHLLEGPWVLGLDLDPGTGPDRRLLDLRTGVLLREGPPGSGVRTLRFLAADRRGVLLQRAEGPAGALPATGPPAASDGTTLSSGPIDGGTWARTSGDRGGIVVASTQTAARHGRRRTLERLSAYAVDPRRPPPVSRARSALDRLEDDGFERVLADHRATWARRWEDACIWVPDEPDTQLAARLALFHLWGSVATHGEAAVGARGLSGQGYAGHVFWDADVFVLPAVASMAPAAARAMLEYRLQRLPQARAQAQARGLEGARFPWESAADGVDVTPTYGRANGQWTPIMTGQLEEHVVADVAWAAQRYADWTGDTAFLEGPGRPLLTETAAFWASRAFTDPDGSAHVRRVIGPDEYHEDVDDNCFTNALARWNLRRGADALPAGDERAAAWRVLADALVDGYDPATGRHEQFRGYDRLEPLLIADVATPPVAADLLLGAARTSGSQLIKQPDVLMAHHLLSDDLPAGSLAADLDFYGPRTAHGSSLSPAVSASVLARAHRPDEALALLDVALRIDLDDLTGMSGSGLHLATLGGVWQALVQGFAGATARDGVLSLDPVLPSRWSTLRLRFRCLGRRVDLRTTTGTALVRVSGPLQLATPGRPPVRVARQAQLVRTDDGWVVQS